MIPMHPATPAIALARPDPAPVAYEPHPVRIAANLIGRGVVGGVKWLVWLWLKLITLPHRVVLSLHDTEATKKVHEAEEVFGAITVVAGFFAAVVAMLDLLPFGGHLLPVLVIPVHAFALWACWSPAIAFAAASPTVRQALRDAYDAERRRLTAGREK